MNADACDALDLIEHTLQEHCYFMSGTMQQCVAKRSTPPPERWFAARERERQHALQLAAECRRSSRSGASSRSVATATPTPSTSAKAPSSVNSRAPRTCQQCGLRSDRCDGARPQKGGSNNCSFKCTRCGVGPLRCQCCATIVTTTPAPMPEGRFDQVVETWRANASASLPASADKENSVPRPLRICAIGSKSVPNPTDSSPAPNKDYGSRKRAALTSLYAGNASKVASTAPDSASLSWSTPSTDESEDDDESWVPVVKRARVRHSVPLRRQRSKPAADYQPSNRACQRGPRVCRCPSDRKSYGSPPPPTPLDEERSTADLLSVICSSRGSSSWSPLSRGSSDRVVATAAVLPGAAGDGVTPARVRSPHPKKLRKPRTCRGCGKGTSECRGGLGGPYGGRDQCKFKCRVCDRGPLLCICRGRGGGRVAGRVDNSAERA